MGEQEQNPMLTNETRVHQGIANDVVTHLAKYMLESAPSLTYAY